MFDCVLLTEIDKGLLTKIQGVYSDENKRQFLLQMETEESMAALAALLENGLTWPGYQNERAGRDVIVRGYPMENPVVNITINGVGLWTSEETLRKAVTTWGEVKEMRQVKIDDIDGYPSFSHIKTDQWKVKLVKGRDVKIPGIVLRLGSERSGEEREI